MKILAIETSCDETAAAVVENGRKVISSVILSQVEEHGLYGGVVPEIASRRHIENISQVVEQVLSEAELTMKEINGVAVTAGPGLVGALLVGVNFAKGLCLSWGLPLIPVHHIRGHVAANYIAHSQLKPPFTALIVSGGHSHIVRVDDYTNYTILGRTTDDAPGEAFDKVARTLGLGYPGGVYIDKASAVGDPTAYKLPTPRTENPYDFSFSGLKTAVINLVHNLEQKGEEVNVEDMAASFQSKVAEVLTNKFVAAAQTTGYNTLVCGGGVAANSGLRTNLEEATRENGMKLYVPPLSLCGDNAVMIASQGFYELEAGTVAGSSLNAYASLSIENPKYY